MSGGFGATPGRGVVVPLGVSVAIFVVFGATPIVCNATRGAAGGFRWSGHGNRTELLTKSVTMACLWSQGILRTSEKCPNLVMKAGNISV